MANLDWALRYLNQKLSVIPLKPNGKEPLIPWVEFQSRRAMMEEVRYWWEKWPEANIGIVTGKISGVAVLDLDGPEGIVTAQKLGLKSSVISLTGRPEGGKHLWYREAYVRNAVKAYPGIDVRGEGGYVVAPPSLHPSGRRYRWLNPLTTIALTALPSLPNQLLTVTGAQSVVVTKEESWIATSLQEMKHGNIDNTLFTILCRLRNDGYSANDARVLLQPHAEKAGATSTHLDDKIENVWNRYEARNPLALSTKSPVQQYGNMRSNLTIHTPANSDSWKQFGARREMETQNGEKLSTGYTKLDQMLTSGLKSSRIFTIAARTGVGKTNFIIGISRNLCEQGKKVLLFSTEMPYEQIWERYLQTLENLASFRQHQFYICDSFAPNLERVEEALNEIKPDVFMFDHINQVSEEQKELGAFMQGLNYLRRKYDCAGVVTAQLNRQADWVDIKTGEKVTPRMSMIKGSGTIEQASSRVLLLSETRVTPEGTEIVGNLDKNDNGPKGLIHFMMRNNPYKMIEL